MTVICTSICYSMRLLEIVLGQGVAIRQLLKLEWSRSKGTPNGILAVNADSSCPFPDVPRCMLKRFLHLSPGCLASVIFSTRSSLRRPSLNFVICFAACVVVLFSTKMLSSLHGWAGGYFLAMSPLSRRNTYSSGSPSLSERSFSLQLIFPPQFRRWRIILVQDPNQEILTITTVRMSHKKRRLMITMSCK